MAQSDDALPVAVLGIADLLMHLEAADFALPPGLGWRLAIAAVIALITAIGGRIIPAFTRNWLMERDVLALPASPGMLDWLALGALHAGLLAWAFLPASKLVGGLLLYSALLNLWRLARWRGLHTISEPLLAILHVGYAWVVVAAALLGMSLLTSSVPEVASVHAFTAGAMGTMMLAIMTRVSRGHTGRTLQADRSTNLIFATITLAGVARVLAGLSSALPESLLDASAVLWVASFLLFAATYGPILVSPGVNKEQ